MSFLNASPFSLFVITIRCLVIYAVREATQSFFFFVIILQAILRATKLSLISALLQENLFTAKDKMHLINAHG